MIVWINGPFGAGKTTLATALLEADPGWAVFDPEEVGVALRRPLAHLEPAADFQDWPIWRHLVVTALHELDRSLRTVIVVPQTVVDEAYWTELPEGLTARDVEVVGVTLHIDQDEHDRQISGDVVEAGAAGWRREQRPRYESARSWLSERTAVVDVTRPTIAQTAEEILRHLAERRLGRRRAMD